MFWGLIMEPGKRYTQTVERAFHVSMACLDPSTADNDNVSVLLVFGNSEFILCSLNKHKAIQTQLDLNFQSGDKIAFMSSGRGRVHLTGYLLETDDDEDDDEEDEGGEELTNTEDSLLHSESVLKKASNSQAKGSGKRKLEPHLPKPENKKVKLQELESEEDDLSSDGDFNFAGDSEDSEAIDDDDDDDVNENEDDDEDDDDDDDDEDEGEEDSEDEEVEATPKQKMPESRAMIKTPTPQNKIPVERMKTPIEKQQKNKTPPEKQQQKNKTPNEKQQQQNKTPNEKQHQQNRTPTEKQQQKNKTPNEKQQQKNKTPTEKQQLKNKTPNEKQQQGATPKSSPVIPVNGVPTPQQSGKKNKKGQETPKGPKTPGGDTPQKKVLEGGVSFEDVRLGNGPVAKPGRELTVYYVGRLKHNNKQFDSTTQGSGFKFRLGRNEVIRGWDIGVTGMKVGGKRKIICPPAMAYGNKGSPPAIPPNSTLIFDVELRAVN